jgi:lipooligosaccharide transport system permease protein
MFLFSGTFFPVSRLHTPLRQIAYATPLYHGVSLCRGLTLGTIGWSAALGHAVYLLAAGVVGFAFALRTYRMRLAT